MNNTDLTLLYIMVCAPFFLFAVVIAISFAVDPKRIQKERNWCAAISRWRAILTVRHFLTGKFGSEFEGPLDNQLYYWYIDIEEKL